jgi:hypothetical protein
MANKPGPKPKGVVSEIASVKDVPQSTLDKLMAEIEGLKEALAIANTARSDAEKVALAAAESQGALMQREIQEVATGKFIKVKRAKGYKVVGYKDDGRDIIKPEWHEVEIPTFFYKIDMPPVGGVDLKINGISYEHGVVYEFDRDTLASVKEMVFRLWAHDRDIHGTDENFYRKPQAPQLSARG